MPSWGALERRIGQLERVQIDHTVVDLEVVDDRFRWPIGRPYVTVTLEAPAT